MLVAEGLPPTDTVLSDRDPAQPAWADATERDWQAWADRVEVRDWDPMVERYVAAGRPPHHPEE